MRQVEDHVCPVLTGRVPTICVLLSGLFQVRVSYFTVYMLLLQDTTIAKQNMRIKTLESSGLAKPDELIMYKAVLYCIQFVVIIYNSLTCFSYKVLYKSISTNRHTNTNSTFRTERSKGDIAVKLSQCRAGSNDAVRHIEHSLLGGALGEDGGLGRH
jgi:hypothetical protein